MYFRKRLISIVSLILFLVSFCFGSYSLADDSSAIHLFIDDVETVGDSGTFYVSMNIPNWQVINEIFIHFIYFDSNSLEITKDDLFIENETVASWTNPSLGNNNPVFVSEEYGFGLIMLHAGRDAIKGEQLLIWNGTNQKIFKINFKLKSTASLPTEITIPTTIGNPPVENVELENANNEYLTYLQDGNSLKANITKWSSLTLLNGVVNTLGTDAPVNGLLNDGKILLGSISQQETTNEEGRFSFLGIDTNNLALFIKKEGYDSKIISLANEDVVNNGYLLSDWFTYNLENKLHLKGDYYGNEIILGENNFSEPDGITTIEDVIWLYKYFVNLYNPDINYELPILDDYIEWSGGDNNAGEISGIIREMGTNKLLTDVDIYLLKIIDELDINNQGKFDFMDSDLSGPALMIIKADDYTTKIIKLTEITTDSNFSAEDLSLQLKNDFYGTGTIVTDPDWNNSFEKTYSSKANGVFDLEDIVYLYKYYQNSDNYLWTEVVNWLEK